MTSVGKRSIGRLLFVGAVHEAEPALAALIGTPVDIVEVLTMPLAQESGPSGYVDLEPLATAHGIPVRRTANINAVEEVEHIRQLAPDVLVVVGWTRLLGADVLAIPPRGCIGFHASLLPHFRGRAPVNWAILRGERETGNTMMYLNVGQIRATSSINVASPSKRTTRAPRCTHGWLTPEPRCSETTYRPFWMGRPLADLKNGRMATYSRSALQPWASRTGIGPPVRSMTGSVP